MTVCLPVELPAAPACQSGVLTLLDELPARVRSAEDRAAGMERAQAGNRRIGMAVGIVMARHGLSSEEAFIRLRKASNDRNVKLAVLADDVVQRGNLER